MIETLFRRFCIYEEEYIKILQEIELLVPDGFEVEDVLGFKNISSWESKKLVDVDFDTEYSKVLISNSEIALYVPVPTNIILANTDEIARKYARAASCFELIVNGNKDLGEFLIDKLREEHDKFMEFKKSLN